MRALLIGLLPTLIALVGSPCITWAGKLNVANNGLDSGACGPKSDPCRSITQAIANARSGDEIVVGPGRYGDLNGDGLFDRPGEETPEAGCFCMLHVDKAVTVLSRDGAAATVIHAGGAHFDVVRVSADGATFGGPRKGFTLTGSNRIAGLAVPVVAEGVSVIGNVSVANPSGFQILGGGHTVKSNLAIANTSNGFSTGNSERVLFDGNASIANGGRGFDIASTGDRDHVVTRNLASGNGDTGFLLQGFDFTVTRNVASGNEEGFVASSAAGPNNHRLDLNAAVGNIIDGIDLQSPIGTGSITRSNLFGNLAANCGLRGDDVDASKSYWGAAGGPGAEPADEACGSNALVDPVSKKENRVKPAWPKL